MLVFHLEHLELEVIDLVFLRLNNTLGFRASRSWHSLVRAEPLLELFNLLRVSSLHTQLSSLALLLVIKHLGLKIRQFLLCLLRRRINCWHRCSPFFLSYLSIQLFDLLRVCSFHSELCPLLLLPLLEEIFENDAIDRLRLTLN